MNNLNQTLNEILNTIKSQSNIFLLPQKKILTFDEACEYCGLSASSMYKHTSSKNIPHYKPQGKLIVFKREELDNWLLQNKQITQEEIEQKALQYSINGK